MDEIEKLQDELAKAKTGGQWKDIFKTCSGCGATINIAIRAYYLIDGNYFHNEECQQMYNDRKRVENEEDLENETKKENK